MTNLIKLAISILVSEHGWWCWYSGCTLMRPASVVVLLITCDKIRVDLVNSFSAGIRGHKNKPQSVEPCPVFRNETEAPLYYYRRYSAVFHFADQNSHDRS